MLVIMMELIIVTFCDFNKSNIVDFEESSKFETASSSNKISGLIAMLE